MNFVRKLTLLLLCICAIGPPLFSQSTAGPFSITSTSTANCPTISTAAGATVGIDVSGTFSATLQPQIAITPPGGSGTPRNTSVTPYGSTTAQNTITAAGGYHTTDIAGASTFILCASGYVSGTAVVTLTVTPLSSHSGGPGGGSGTVTSVASGTGLTGGPVTGSGTISLITPVTAANGGTGVANTATLTLGTSNQNWATLGTGLVKNTTTTGALTNGASADVIALFSTCSGTQYLGADGSCHTPGGLSGLTTGQRAVPSSPTALTTSGPTFYTDKLPGATWDARLFYCLTNAAALNSLPGYCDMTAESGTSSTTAANGVISSAGQIVVLPPVSLTFGNTFFINITGANSGLRCFQKWACVLDASNNGSAGTVTLNGSGSFATGIKMIGGRLNKQTGNEIIINATDKAWFWENWMVNAGQAAITVQNNGATSEAEASVRYNIIDQSGSAAILVNNGNNSSSTTLNDIGYNLTRDANVNFNQNTQGTIGAGCSSANCAATPPSQHGADHNSFYDNIILNQVLGSGDCNNPNFGTLNITSWTGNGTTVQLTYTSAQPSGGLPAIGQSITVAGVAAGVNGTNIVSASTTATVSFLNATSGSASGLSGTITYTPLSTDTGCSEGIQTTDPVWYSQVKNNYVSLSSKEGIVISGVGSQVVGNYCDADGQHSIGGATSGCIAWEKSSPAQGMFTMGTGVTASMVTTTATFSGAFTVTNLAAGDIFDASGFTVSGYNTIWTIVTVSGSTITATASGVTSLGAATSGTLTGPAYVGDTVISDNIITNSSSTALRYAIQHLYTGTGSGPYTAQNVVISGNVIDGSNGSGGFTNGILINTSNLTGGNIRFRNWRVENNTVFGATNAFNPNSYTNITGVALCSGNGFNSSIDAVPVAGNIVTFSATANCPQPETDSGVVAANVVTNSTTGTSGVIPQFSASKAITNSSPVLDNGNTTANVLTYAGSGGITASAGPLTSGVPAGGVGSSVFLKQEGTIPTGLSAAGQDNCYSDATQHGVLCNFNAGTTLPLLQGPASDTTNTLAKFSGTNGGKVVGSTITDNATTVSTSEPLVAQSYDICSDTSGSGTAQICNTTPTFTVVTGSCFTYTTTTANTGTALTINPNSLGAKSVSFSGSTTLAANYIKANQQVVACYDGTNIEISKIDVAVAAAAPSLDQVTGSAAQATATETAISHEWTYAGVETAALTYPIVFKNNNATNTTSGALAVYTTGAGNAQVPLAVYQNTLAGNLANFGQATITNGVVSAITNQAQIGSAGLLTLGAATGCGTSQTAGDICGNEGTPSTGTANVDIFHEDATQHAAEVNNNNTGFMPVERTVCVNVTPVTVAANVTTDQLLMACSINANLLNVVGRTLRVYVAGVFSTAAASMAALTIKVKFCTVSGCGSGTVIAPVSTTTGATAALSATNLSFSQSSYITTQTAGATAAFEAHGFMTIDLSATAATPDSVYQDTNTATVGTIDSTAADFIQVTMAASAASTSNSFTERQLIVTALN